MPCKSLQGGVSSGQQATVYGKLFGAGASTYRIKSKFKQKQRCLNCLLLFLFYQQVFRVASLHDATHYQAHFPQGARRSVSAKRTYFGVARYRLSPLFVFSLSGRLGTCAKRCVCVLFWGHLEPRCPTKIPQHRQREHRQRELQPHMAPSRLPTPGPRVPTADASALCLLAAQILRGSS